MVCWSLVALILLVIALMYNCAPVVANRWNGMKARSGAVHMQRRRSGFDSSTSTPYCSPTTHTCVGCVADADCVTGFCDPATNQCVECTDENVSKCPDDSKQCNSGKCVQCKTGPNGEAIGCGPGQVCDKGRCVQCAVDPDCPTSGVNGGPGACAAGTCAECRVDEKGVAIGCPADFPFCGPDGKCRKCIEGGAGCATGYCYIGPDEPRNKCVECLEWKHCATSDRPTPPEALCGPHGKMGTDGTCVCNDGWGMGPPDPSRPSFCRACAEGRGPRGDCSKDLHTEADGSPTVFTVPGGNSDFNYENYCFFSGKDDDTLNASCQTAFGSHATVYKMPSGRNNDWNPCNDDSDKSCKGANISRPVCKVSRYFTDHGAAVTDPSYGICNLNGPDSNGYKTTAYPPGFDSKNPLLYQ
jgi:hypothetical protein